MQNLQSVRFAPLQRGEDHRFEMPTQLVALSLFHAFILDRLGIGIKSRPRRFRPYLAAGGPGSGHRDLEAVPPRLIIGLLVRVPPTRPATASRAASRVWRRTALGR